MKASETLARARDLLFEEDWSPNAHRGPRGPRCAFWAIVDAETEPYEPRTYRSPCSFFKAAIGCDDIPTWNDAPERTFAEVVDAFNRAELAAKEHEAAA
jgi:hypothetical protein